VGLIFECRGSHQEKKSQFVPSVVALHIHERVLSIAQGVLDNNTAPDNFNSKKMEISLTTYIYTACNSFTYFKSFPLSFDVVIA
jgi:hypothetical protein